MVYWHADGGSCSLAKECPPPTNFQYRVNVYSIECPPWSERFTAQSWSLRSTASSTMHTWSNKLHVMLHHSTGYYKVALRNMWHVLGTMLHQTSHGWLNAETLERAPTSLSCRLVRCSAHEHSFASLQYLQLRFHSLWHVLLHFIEVSEF